MFTLKSLVKTLAFALLLFGFVLTSKEVQAQAAPNEPAPPLLTNIKQISAGGLYTCVLTTSGGIKCWGYNTSGQLGDGGSSNRPFPMDVVGLTSGVKAISAGGGHACALMETGGVKCWGSNENGALGNTIALTITTPADVVGLSTGVKAIDAGDGSTCALMETGVVKCWGTVMGKTSTPVDVPELNGVAELAVGWIDACARTTAGGVKCWGGDKTFVQGYPAIPVDIAGLTSGVVALDGTTESFCAVTTDSVKCWGDNSYGELPSVDSWHFTPVAVSGVPADVKAISVGMASRCVVTQEDKVLCWGNNWHGSLGNNTIAHTLFCREFCSPDAVSAPRISPPAIVEGLDGPLQAITSNGYHTCVLSAVGTVKCWAYNISGVIGIEPSIYMPYPKPVQNLEQKAVSLELGGWHTCARVEDGSYQCWGYNGYNQLGTGDAVTHWSPRPLTVITDSIKSLAAGLYHSCAVTAAGAAQCWGSNLRGQLGSGTFEDSLLTPINVVGLDNGAAQVVVGYQHSCALLDSGGVQCWGARGQFSGYDSDTPVPVQIEGLESGVAAITAGAYHTCALMTDGRVKCWGGHGVQDVTGLRAPVAAIDAGFFFNCALLVIGGVQCWGFNTTGELGIGYGIFYSATPVDVRGLQSGVTAISAGDSYACAVTTTGAQCWGSNRSGRIGDGLVPYIGDDARYTPVHVVDVNHDIVEIFAGGTHTCAIMKDRSVKCWGLSEDGQLGYNPGWSAMDIFDARLLFLPYAGR